VVFKLRLIVYGRIGVGDAGELLNKKERVENEAF
jgi:hypothetical protein